MYECKFEKFNFEEFMYFVLNLVDYYGLGYVRFRPDKPEYFDGHQLTHIAPDRTIKDKHGFAHAWSNYSDKVREVTFDQYNKDETKKIIVTINLDKNIVKLDSVAGLPEEVIEDLIEKRFGGIRTFSDIRLEKLRLRMSILELLLAVAIAFVFALLYAVIKKIGFQLNWSILFNYFALFFGVIFTIIYILLPLIEVIKKVGGDVKKVAIEIVAEFRNTSKLTKFMYLIAILGFIAGLIK